jgi:hypothetical protein
MKKNGFYNARQFNEGNVLQNAEGLLTWYPGEGTPPPSTPARPFLLATSERDGSWTTLLGWVMQMVMVESDVLSNLILDGGHRPR